MVVHLFIILQFYFKRGVHILKETFLWAISMIHQSNTLVYFSSGLSIKLPKGVKNKFCEHLSLTQ